MQIISISRGSYGFGSDLARALAEKLGYACVGREQVTDKVTDFGIPVGKIEIDVLKNKPITEERSINIDLFKAFVTRELCERAATQGIVYHGRAGHLVLPGLSNVLRVRAIADEEYRIDAAMARMNLDRKKARDFIDQTDQDIRRWVRILYNEDLENPAMYDLTINAHHMSVESAAHFLMNAASLPEFQATPASSQTLSDLILAARCRLAIGMHEHTCRAKVMVKAEHGHVSVTYLPRQADQARAIPKVLETVPGIQGFVCTQASTNILYLGETFDPQVEHMDHLIDIAEKWNAAVEMIRIMPGGPGGTPAAGAAPGDRAENGGILEDAPPGEEMDPGLSETMHRLIKVGRAGCTHTSHGGVAGLIQDVPKSVDYSLMVVGDVFSGKGMARHRLKRDLVSRLADTFRCPVLAAEELKARYLFGKKQLAGLIVSAVLSALIYLAVFQFQAPVLRFVGAGQTGGSLLAKAASATVIAVCVPVIALVIGAFYHNLLKLIRLE
ncbi:hypothetical protein JCM14469_28000 [Desulfatiferula olefinivorans]